jgi:hypothetical protein
MTPLSVTVSSTLNHENTCRIDCYTPPNPARLESFYYYSQLCAYWSNYLWHNTYWSSYLRFEVSELMTLRMRRLDKTQTKTPPDKCWDTLRIGVYRFFTRIDQFIYVSSYNKWWSSTSSPKSRENFILNPNCECTNNGGLPLVSINGGLPLILSTILYNIRRSTRSNMISTDYANTDQLIRQPTDRGRAYEFILRRGTLSPAIRELCLT